MRKFIYHLGPGEGYPFIRKCTDVCPYVEIRTIGSEDCQKCPFCVAVDYVKNIVYCIGDEHPLKEE